MSTEIVNVKFRCPAELHESLENMKIARGVSTQHLCVEALREYLSRDSGEPKKTFNEWLDHVGELREKHPDLFQAAWLKAYADTNVAVVQYLEANPEHSLELMRALGFNLISAKDDSEKQALVVYQMLLRELPEATRLAVQTIILQMIDWFRASRRRIPASERKDDAHAQED